MQGRLVWIKQAGTATGFSIKGAFLYQIINGNGKVLYVGKSVGFY
jgi:hypothetical protein